MPNKNNKVAIVYDWIDKWGGVERVLLHLHSLFPDADFFTSAVDRKAAQWARGFSIQSSFLQAFPSWLRANRALLAPLFPLAFESFKFDDYSLVISITSAFAKGIITKPGTKHICYLLTPPRYLWSHTKDYLPGIKGILAQPLYTHLKNWDRIASHRPDAYISLSQTTAERVREYYHIETPVVYPPFDTEYWDLRIMQMKEPKGILCKKPYYLSVGRMETYKKTDLIIDVARQNKSGNFIFVGTGSLEKDYKKKAPQNCQFLSRVSDEELSYLYSHARAFIMPQNEDFGYVSLEAQYHGCPVVAYRAGGACETVIEGESGLFFDDQTAQSLASQLERFEQISYNLIHSTRQMKKTIREKFGIQRFTIQLDYQLKRFNSL